MEFGILIHSHDVQLFLLLQHILATEGFTASLTDKAEETLAETGNDSVRAVIVDCSAPGAEIDRLGALKTRWPNVALVRLLTKTAAAPSRALGGDGSDLILGQPFNPALLIDFLRHMRSDIMMESGRPEIGDHLLCFADLEMNTASVAVRRNGHGIPLTALQFRLLRHLMKNVGRVQSRDDLIAAAWSDDFGVEPRTVDIHIGHVRRALKRFGPDLIRTVRTRGYVLDAETAPESPPERSDGPP